jgi:hypothetical protein
MMNLPFNRLVVLAFFAGHNSSPVFVSDAVTNFFLGMRLDRVSDWEISPTA